VCTFNNETSKDYKQYAILSMIILLPIILIKMNENAFSTIYHRGFLPSQNFAIVAIFVYTIV